MGLKNLIVELDSTVFFKKIIKEVLMDINLSEFEITPELVDGKYLSVPRGKFLNIELWREGAKKVDMSMPLEAIFDIDDYLDDELKNKIRMNNLDLNQLIFESLKNTGFAEGGVIHAFSGSVEVAKAYVDKGFYIGVGGTITYDRAKKTQETIIYLLQHHPDRLLLETDSPDMPMQGRQGARNSPEYLGDVLAALGKLGEYDGQALNELTTQNYLTLFHKGLFCNRQ